MDGKLFRLIGKEFIAREGKWVGAKIGIFSSINQESTTKNFANFDWFRFK
ncbi:hypothetical protein [Clostridium sp.]